MDSKNDHGEKRPASVLQGDGFYFNRILSRDSSVGQSSRIYYRRAEGVPFKWEMQPGTPRNLPEEEVIPPLSPPPLVQSKGLPKPCVDQPKRPNQSKVWFWKKIKIIHQVRKVRISSGRPSADPGLKVHECFHLGDSDGEFIASRNNSCSSSFSTSHSLESSSVRRESLHGPFAAAQATWQ